MPAAKTNKPMRVKVHTPVSAGASRQRIPRMMAMTPKIVILLPPALAAFVNSVMIFSFLIWCLVVVFSET
jgi:hypothetical protein